MEVPEKSKGSTGAICVIVSCQGSVVSAGAEEPVVINKRLEPLN